MHDDVEFEDDMEGAPAEGAGLQKTKRLEEKLERVTGERDEYLLGWQRAKADFVNARTRFERDLESVAKEERVRVIATLIPLLDTLEEARKHGVEYEQIYQQAWKPLQELGLERLVPQEGDVCDLTHAEHVGSEASSLPEGTVLRVVQNGYVLDGTIMRTAKVVISEGN